MESSESNHCQFPHIFCSYKDTSAQAYVQKFHFAQLFSTIKVNCTAIFIFAQSKREYFRGPKEPLTYQHYACQRNKIINRNKSQNKKYVCLSLCVGKNYAYR